VGRWHGGGASLSSKKGSRLGGVPADTERHGQSMLAYRQYTVVMLFEVQRETHNSCVTALQ